MLAARAHAAEQPRDPAIETIVALQPLVAGDDRLLRLDSLRANLVQPAFGLRMEMARGKAPGEHITVTGAVGGAPKPLQLPLDPGRPPARQQASEQLQGCRRPTGS